MINLLPYKEKKSIEKIRGILFARTIAAGFVFVAFAAIVLLIPTIVTINSRFNIVTSQIKSLENSGSIASDVDIASLVNRAQISQSKLFIPEIVQPTQYIDLVKSIIPNGIVVDRFVVDVDKNLAVSGTAQSREILQLFIKNLEQNDKVASVDNPVSNFIKNNNSLFKITISFK
jgi:hypothetical protein